VIFQHRWTAQTQSPRILGGMESASCGLFFCINFSYQ
jgi:hypothetical protein